mmetsp:Transcript_15024/g.32740  ORF Transcript_15024/g.32740 Transcript_15024/m.32740 type:complete len:694 (-) Transcript_15024:169-2250(-)
MPRPSNSQQAEDEALALALQMQFERESQTAQPMPPPVAPPRPSSSGRPPSRGRSVTRKRSSDLDEEIARRMQEQEIAAASTVRNRSQSPVVIIEATGGAGGRQQQQLQRSRSNTSRQRSRSNTSSSRHHRQRSSTPTGRQPTSPKSTSPSVTTLPRPRAASPAPVVISTTNDEDFARQLAAEESRRANNRSNSRSRSQQRAAQQASGGYVFPPPDNGRRSTVPTEVASSSMSEEEQRGPTPASTAFFDEDARHSSLQDAAMARRMEQEMQDELVAERLQQREQRRASKQRATAVQLQPVRRRRKVCGTLVTIATVVGAVVAIVYYFVILDGSVPSINLTPEDFADEDPFDAVGPEDAKRWSNSGNGIALTVLNCLETKWYQYFYDAVDDWDDGYPDTLTLTTEFRDYEYDCNTESYKVKVCNGNYGNTRWKGINEVILDHTDTIIASSARMNEFYMPERDDSQWQYTMCHELGHAWGLPHTDESFTNADLGDCMDYTNNPEVNKQPALSNFEFLYQLYGLVPDAAPYAPPTPAPVVSTPAPAVAPTSAPVTAPPSGSEAVEGLEANQQSTGQTKKNGGGRRVQEAAPPKPLPVSRIRGATASSQSQEVSAGHDNLQAAATRARESIQDPLPQWLQEAIAEALDRPTGRRLDGRKWAVLHQHEHGELHQVDLPRGYKLQVHKLLATSEELERYG